MVKESLKKNLSSVQVLKTLKILMNGDYSMADLIEKMNENEEEPIFNNSVLSKYINTCRQCGIDIPKINNKYFLTKLPFGLDFSEEESELLEKLKNIISEEMTINSQKNFQIFVDKLNRFANKKITRVENKNYVLSFEAFEKALKNRRKVVLIFKNRYELVGIPITISKEKGKVFFQIFCKNKIRMIDAGRLSGIQVSNENFIGYMSEQNVVYTLKGKLAKRYELRPDEQLLKTSDDGSITVSNRCYNTEMLISRLMRYDDLCEIIAPESVKEQMKIAIDDTLKNYGIE